MPLEWREEWKADDKMRAVGYRIRPAKAGKFRAYRAMSNELIGEYDSVEAAKHGCEDADKAALEAMEIPQAEAKPAAHAPPKHETPKHDPPPRTTRR